MIATTAVRVADRTQAALLAARLLPQPG